MYWIIEYIHINLQFVFFSLLYVNHLGSFGDTSSISPVQFEKKNNNKKTTSRLGDTDIFRLI